MDEKSEQLKGLAILLKPFEANEISKLPKPTKQQTDDVKRDFKAGTRCKVCEGWHHPKVVHLDYVGHAALTKRLLEADPLWNWEPVTLDETGSPALDRDGGMWIYLTVCGMTRRGYGDAQGKTGPNATKERIGDALRNAAMRFGAALDLWHKGDLHQDDDSAGEVVNSKPVQEQPAPQTGSSAANTFCNSLVQKIDKATTGQELIACTEATNYESKLERFPEMIKKVNEAIDAKMSALTPNNNSLSSQMEIK